MTYDGWSPSYIFPTLFVPPKDYPTPGELFPASINRTATSRSIRFINRQDAEAMLIYTHGSCLDNGRAKARAACAYICEPSVDGCIASGLESLDFSGNVPTSPRAELWAAISALRRHRVWVGEGFTTLVLTSHSEYLVKGATEWAPAWVRNNWRGGSRKAKEVDNRDVWEILLEEVKRCHEAGLTVQMWKIRKGLDEKAYRAANGAAWTVHIPQ
ncbi:hypothetical protein E4U17_006134 [Claviceps sp. LM77 group G4]|nr:hypothetical protein E4U17_006134 [Claviceps sp. LM77 group G4]KAG6082120.1 hypothetical protein E4U33_006025 [Claviceps sp. LM78 group G4]